MIYLALIAAAVLAWWLWRHPGVRRVVERSQWRPTVGVLVMAALVAAVAAALRGAWVPGLAAAAVALWAALFVRRQSVEEEGSSVAPRESLSVTEARSLLGVEIGADAGTVEEAYRRLMRRAHPDLGGSTCLAAQLNAARATLLAERGP